MNNLVIGVLGGMGPDATISFYHNLTKATRAKTDQDHFHVIIDSNAKIPDRTAHILRGEPSPLDAMIASAKRLEAAGADVICMPCITGHSFADEIAAAIDIPFIDAIKATDAYIKLHHPEVERIGILCTSGAKHTKVYDNTMTDFELLYPDDAMQESHVMGAIYGKHGIKAGFTTGRPANLLTEAAESLIERGAQLIIAGCTEIPLAFTKDLIDYPYVDPMSTVIDTIIEMAGE